MKLGKELVVTRHSGLVSFLRSEGIIDEDAEVTPHATAEMVRGRHVIGVLPLDLAAETLSITIVPLALTPDMRGRDLSEDEVRRIAGAPRTFSVMEVGVGV